MRLTARGYPAEGRVLVLEWGVFRRSTVNDLADRFKLEAEMDDLLDNLLSDNLYAYTEVRSNSVLVRIYKGPWNEGPRVLSRLEYDLTVLEPGLEEAAKRIHLDWLFS